MNNNTKQNTGTTKSLHLHVDVGDFYNARRKGRMLTVTFENIPESYNLHTYSIDQSSSDLPFDTMCYLVNEPDGNRYSPEGIPSNCIPKSILERFTVDKKTGLVVQPSFFTPVFSNNLPFDGVFNKKSSMYSNVPSVKKEVNVLGMEKSEYPKFYLDARTKYSDFLNEKDIKMSKIAPKNTTLQSIKNLQSDVASQKSYKNNAMGLRKLRHGKFFELGQMLIPPAKKVEYYRPKQVKAKEITGFDVTSVENMLKFVNKYSTYKVVQKPKKLKFLFFPTFPNARKVQIYKESFNKMAGSIRIVGTFLFTKK
jgi:hypothetical protein